MFAALGDSQRLRHADQADAQQRHIYQPGLDFDFRQHSIPTHIDPSPVFFLSHDPSVCILFFMANFPNVACVMFVIILSRASHQVWQGCAKDTHIELVRNAGGTHKWIRSADFDTSVHIIEFLMKFGRRV